VVVTVQIFLGVLLGFLAGMFLSARYLRQEIAANIGPRLAHIERQLEILQGEVNLDMATRIATLSESLQERPLRDLRFVKGSAVVPAMRSMDGSRSALRG
jgi:hypothetical protein